MLELSTMSNYPQKHSTEIEARKARRKLPFCRSSSLSPALSDLRRMLATANLPPWAPVHHLVASYRRCRSALVPTQGGA